MEHNTAGGPEWQGFVFQGKNYEGLICCFLEMFWAHGGRLEIDPIRNTPLIDNNPIIVDTLSWYQKSIRNGLIPSVVYDGGSDGTGLSESPSEALFRNGNFLIHRNWPRTYDRLNSNPKFSHLRPKIKVFEAPLPMDGVNPTLAKMTLGGWAYAITKFAEERGVAEESMRVVEALTSREWFEAMVCSQQLSPSDEEFSIRVPADEDLLRRRTADNPAVELSYSSLNARHYRNRPVIPNYRDFSKIFSDCIYSLLQKFDKQKSKSEEVSRSEIEEALRSAQNKINTDLSLTKNSKQ